MTPTPAQIEKARAIADYAGNISATHEGLTIAIAAALADEAQRGREATKIQREELRELADEIGGRHAITLRRIARELRQLAEKGPSR